MGNNQSQTNPIHKLPRKIANKLPGSSLRDRQKDSGYGSGSASSSGTTKGGATVASTNTASEQGSTLRPETAPDVMDRVRVAPVLPTQSAEMVGPQ